MFNMVLITFYFSLSSLSTVGFGDFVPKSDFERTLCVFIFLFGVSLFSRVMSMFIQIID